MRTTLRENEKIVMITLRHPVTIIWLYAAAIAFLVLWIWVPKAAIKPYVGYLFIVLVAVSVLKTWARQRDIWVVTDERIIDEQGIFATRSMECPLDKITNVTVAQSVPGRLLGYGKIQIQTAGKAGITEEAKVMRPKALRIAIFEQQERSREKMMQTRAATEAEQPVQEGEMKECPFCAEKIRARAKICRFCNRELPQAARDDNQSSLP